MPTQQEMKIILFMDFTFSCEAEPVNVGECKVINPSTRSLWSLQ